MDGQKAMVFFGTSILDGDGAVSKQWGGVNPANNSPANYDQLGFPSAYAQSLTTQVAVLNFGVGASAAMNLWAMSGTSPDWITNTEDVALQKATISKLLKWFDITTVYDPNNDTESTLIGCYYNFSSTARASNPKIKVYGIKVPNGGVKEDGTTTAYSSGGLDAKYADMDTALSNGWIHGIWDLQEGTKVFPDLGTQYSGTTTSSGSMTTLNDSGATWQRNQWTNSFVNIGGTKKLISSNTRTQLTFATFASSVLSGTAYSIEGNTSGDQLHPNTVGQAYLGALLKQRIDATESIPYFTRTQ
ncbi:MAG: hypothetical protein JST51_11620 [Armatimonadetes bacterium]|nr:hypothetical protein [Armatimonadota bacterium]